MARLHLVFVLSLTVAAGAAERSALAQSEPPQGESLAAGRALFGEALIDEGAGRYRTALDKFGRVKAIRDTAPVEYRIATCEEGLGHLPAAYQAYDAAVSLGASEPSMNDVVQAARTRRDELSKRVARLTLVPPDSATAFSVQVDDATYPREALGQPIVLDAGTHTVVATAFGQGPFRSRVSIPEGGVASLPIAFGQAGADSPGASPSPSPAPPGEAPAAAAGNNRALGWILTGAGGALLVGSGVLLLLRHQDISTLDSACPGGTCPPGASKSDLDATRDRALVEGPFAGGLAAAGLISAAVGVYFVVTSHGSRPAAAVSLAPTAHGAGLAIAGSFR
ncbi:MAG: hypothetical protein ACRENE_31060 [Polyangiaceae bacterium]